MGTLDITLGDEANFAEADVITIDVAGGSDSEVGIKTRPLTLISLTWTQQLLSTLQARTWWLSVPSTFRLVIQRARRVISSSLTAALLFAATMETAVNISNTLADAEGDGSDLGPWKRYRRGRYHYG